MWNLAEIQDLLLPPHFAALTQLEMAPEYRCTFVLLLAVVSVGSELSCESSGGIRQCSLPSAPQRVSLIGDKFIVGAVDYLFAFNLHLTYLDDIDLSPSADRRYTCEISQAHQPALCRNFIRVIQPVQDPQLGDKILACGTNAFFPKCRLHNLANLSDWLFMTEEGQQDVGFSPHSNVTNVGLLASNERFFTATIFAFRQTQRTIGMALAPLESDGTFAVQTPGSDPLWIHLPVFVSAHEVGERIYFFAREPAYEVDYGEAVEYSRAIRICKNDPGFQHFPSDPTLTFLTFQKARMVCTHSGRDGSIPYSYDRLQATFLLRSDTGDPVLYGAFSSASNGPEGAAICKFSFSQLESVFEEGDYLVMDEHHDNRWTRASTTSFVCPGQEGNQRSEEHAKKYQLVFSPATPLEPHPIHRVSGDEFTNLAVDVAEYRGQALEVMVLGLKSGDITQVAVYGSAVYKTTLRRVGSTINDLIMFRPAGSEVRQVTFTTDRAIHSFSLGNCSLYTSCYECFDSRDPYCAWSQSSGRCVNKMEALDPTSLLDSLATSAEVVSSACTSPQPTVSPSTSSTTSTSSVHCPGHSETECPATSSDKPLHTPSLGETGGLDQSENGREEVGLLAGATVGGFVVGIPVGLVICYLFFTTFLKHHRPQAAPRASSAVHMNNNSLESSGDPRSVELQKQFPDTRYVEQTRIQRSQQRKEVNQFKFGEDDDVLTELPSNSTNNILKDSFGVPTEQHPRMVPGYRVPRGRTESTRWLRASESSEHASDLSPSSPLVSPV